MWRRALVIVAAVSCFPTSIGTARAQNDWQFPDPYFGAIEFDVSRPVRPRQPRIESAPPSRPPSVTPRPPRQRPRWSTRVRR